MNNELAVFEELTADELLKTHGGSCLVYTVQVCIPQIIYITGSSVYYF